MLLPMLLWFIAAISCGVAADCNPLTTTECAAIPGLASSSYTIDFTKEKSLPKDWILADSSNVTFGNNGAQFNFNKRKDAPYIWTNFYVAYGRIDVEMQVATGTGIITSAVMFSDDADEIDWEFSGSNFGAGTNTGKIQTNVFAKGMTGNYDRGTLQPCSPPPQTSFHTYTLNWTPDRIDWILDGETIYSTTNNGQKSGNYQFPQTPSRLHLGIWDAGDPDTAPGTRNWAGGYTDYSKTPYVAYVKNVKISTPYPCKTWKYPINFSGSWSDVKCTNETLPTSTSASATSTATMPKITTAEYTVVAGDNGYSIADELGCTFDQLSAANPDVKWDFLDIGQKLNNPNAITQSISSSSPSTTPSISKTSTASTSIASSTSAAQSGSSSSGIPRRTSNGSTTISIAGSTSTSIGSGGSISIIGLNPTIKISGTGTGSGSTIVSSIVGSTSTSTGSGGSISIIGLNPTIKTSGTGCGSTIVPSTAATTTAPLTCSQDQCLNSMVASQFLSSASTFCSNLNQTTTLATPAYLSGCDGNATRVRSACSCVFFNSITASVPVTSSTSATAIKSNTSATSSASTSAAPKTSSSNAGSSNYQGNWGSGTVAGNGWGIWSSGWKKPWKRDEKPHYHVSNIRYGRLDDERIP